MGNLSAPLHGGLIGCGFVSRYHLEGWESVPAARLVALCDLDRGRLERAAARIPGARLYRDAEAMFGAESLDFVELCTRPGANRALVALAARRGVHVLCQKPAATDRPDFLAMIEAAEAGGVRLMIHENWRFRPWYRSLRTRIDSGAIGRPIRLRIAHRDTRALRPEGFADQPYFAAMPRLILLEMGCHLVDTARFLLGEVAQVSATLGRFGADHPGEDVATLSIGFASGALGLLDMSWCAPADLARPEWALNETVVEGTAGALRLLQEGTLCRVDLEGRTEEIPVPLASPERVYVEGYVATQAHFIAGLLGGIEHETRATDNLKTMEIVWAGYRSAEERRTIVLGDDAALP